MLMHQLLSDGAARTPDRIAFRWVDRDRSLSYAQAVVEMERATGALNHLGLRKGDRVTIFAHNGLDYLVGMFACWRLGAIAALVNVRLVNDLDYYLSDHTPTAIIYTHDMHSAVKISTVKHLLCMDGPQEGAQSWPELLTGHFTLPAEPTDAEAIAHLSYTSGSTGKPKGACLAHEPTLRATRCIAERLRISSDDISFGPTALSSSYQLVGNLLPPLHRGATVNVMGSWTPQAGLAAMTKADASIFVANPILLADVLEEVRKGGTLPPRLRISMSGGAPVPPELKRAWRDELKVPLAESYGQSELGGFVALGSPELPSDAEIGAVGFPLPDKEVRIFGADGCECATGEVGEICLSGGFMSGYWGKPDKTAEALRGGWLHTGDAGVIDAAGRVTMRGRFSELLSVAGRTWFPRDVEEALVRHPAVRDAAVVGVPDEVLGHRPHAFVTLETEANPIEIRVMVDAETPYDLSVLTVTPLSVFPMTPTGKIAKMDLIAMALKGA